MSLPDKFRLLSPYYVEREITGQTYRFYPNSVRVAARLSDLISELIGNFSVLMHNTDRDAGSKHEEIKDPSGGTISTTQIDAVSPEVLQLRVAQREKASRAALSALLNPKYRLLVGELLMDSMRDDFTRGAAASADDAQDLVDSMEVPVLMEFIKGLVAANSKVFGDLGKDLRDALGKQVNGLLSKVPEAAPTAG